MVVCAATQPMTRGNSALMSCVSSIPNIIAVRGERMVPPIMAAMPTSAQMPVSVGETKPPNNAPMTPPMMRRGARTPPEVPEPRATDQMTAFTANRRSAGVDARSPCSRAAMLS